MLFGIKVSSKAAMESVIHNGETEEKSEFSILTFIYFILQMAGFVTGFYY